MIYYSKIHEFNKFYDRYPAHKLGTFKFVAKYKLNENILFPTYSYLYWCNYRTCIPKIHIYNLKLYILINRTVKYII